MMKLLIPSLVAATFLCGCAAGPVKTTALEAKGDFEIVGNLIATQAKECWTKRVAPLKKGIYVTFSKPTQSEIGVSAFRVEWAGPQPKKPFITITVKSENGLPKVNITENDFTCGIYNGCVNLNLAEDVDNWINGTRSCKNIDKMLLALGLGF